MTDLSGIQQAVQKIADQQLKDQAKAGAEKGTPNADDVAKLQAALNQPPAGAEQAGQAGQVQNTQKVEAVHTADSSSPGSRILDNIHNMRSNFQQAVQELHATVDGANPVSPADMLKVQMKMQSVMMQQELAGKVVSKSEQNIDTLLKGQ
jgi:hypothetical protein